MHGIISEGRRRPEHRAEPLRRQILYPLGHRDYLNGLTEKVINIARGAELMTGAKMSYRFFENSFDDLNNCEPLRSYMEANLRAAGETDFEESDPNVGGSTDIGNVSQVCPTFYVPMAAGNTDGARCHDEAFLADVNSPAAYTALNRGVKAMAATAVDAVSDPALWQEVCNWIDREKN